VSKGSVRVVGGKLAGSFVVKNAGRASAGRSAAALSVRVAGRSRGVTLAAVQPLRRSKSATAKVRASAPRDLRAGTYAVRACADAGRAVRESSERNNCRTVGSLRVAATVPGAPVPFTKNSVFTLDSPQSNYWVYVPDAYDASHKTPITLLVWLHGCGGEASGDIFTVSPGGSQSWISIAVGGREDACWDVNADGAKVFAAIDSMKSHFNIDPHRVILGGYSSGGDLSYRTAFDNSDKFAGVLAENTSPFRDTGSTQEQSLAAKTKFHVVHLAHTSDEAYPIDGVRQETDAMKAAGFPITRIERAGTHFDADAGDTGTDHDLQTLLLPHINDGWTSP
jgi:dienelactone hydrolase